MPGIGVLSSTALAATLGDAKAWRSGREFSASLGLMPAHAATGGKRASATCPSAATVPAHAAHSRARAVIEHAKDKPKWPQALLRAESERGGGALANKFQARLARCHPMNTREDALALDAADPLAPLRQQFDIPPGLIYLDGNSLGVLPKATPARVQQVVTQEWGVGLIGSWNSAGWMDLAPRIGDKIAPPGRRRRRANWWSPTRPRSTCSRC